MFYVSGELILMTWKHINRKITCQNVITINKYAFYLDTFYICSLFDIFLQPFDVFLYHCIVVLPWKYNKRPLARIFFHNFIFCVRNKNIIKAFARYGSLMFQLAFFCEVASFISCIVHEEWNLYRENGRSFKGKINNHRKFSWCTHFSSTNKYKYLVCFYVQQKIKWKLF